jgi:hypothetical protein
VAIPKRAVVLQRWPASAEAPPKAH